MLRILGRVAVLLVQVRGENTVLPAVTTLLLPHSTMDRGNEFSVVSTA